MKKFITALMLLTIFAFNANAGQITMTKDNSVVLNAVVTQESVTKAIKDLSIRESNSEPEIYLYLDTPGGDVFAGLNLINYLNTYKKPVITITGFSASMGFQIAQGNPGKRLILPTGILMSHPMSGSLYGNFGSGLSIENQNGFLKEVIDTMDKNTVKRTNGKQTMESYQKSYSQELWTTGQFAVDGGYADEVVSAGCSEDLVTSTDTYNVRSYVQGPISFEVKYEYSNCPLGSSITKYQVSFVNIITEEKYIIMNSGYDIDKKISPMEQLLKMITNIDTESQLKSSVAYNQLMFLLKKDYRNVVKDISKL